MADPAQVPVCRSGVICLQISLYGDPLEPPQPLLPVVGWPNISGSITDISVMADQSVVFVAFDVLLQVRGDGAQYLYLASPFQYMVTAPDPMEPDALYVSGPTEGLLWMRPGAVPRVKSQVRFSDWEFEMPPYFVGNPVMPGNFRSVAFSHDPTPVPFVAFEYLGVIYRLDPDGVGRILYTSEFHVTEELDHLAIHEPYVYLADYWRSRVGRLHLETGEVEHQWSGLCDGRSNDLPAPVGEVCFDQPGDVAVDPFDGTVYVAAGDPCLYAVAPDGMVDVFAGDCEQIGQAGNLGDPRDAVVASVLAVEVDAHRNVYFSDSWGSVWVIPAVDLDQPGAPLSAPNP